MNISFDEFEKEVSSLHAVVQKHFEQFETPKRKLIIDGVVNVTEYYNSPIKIMWVLKEPYCDKQNGGGDWSMREGLQVRALGKKTDSQSTWHPIIYTTYGILHDFIKYERMPDIADKQNISSVLKRIAFINIQKLPAKTRTSEIALKSAYQKHKEILLQQVSTYRPDIIIGGKTLHLFKNELGITKENELQYGHFAKNKQLFINTFHPAQTKIKRSEYVNKIIERAETWKSVYS